MTILKNFGITLFVFLVFDYIWLGIIAKSFFTKHLGYIARMKGGSIDAFIPSAIVAYLLMALALEIFVLSRAGDYSWMKLAMFGALLGFFSFGIYDFTNHAVIKDYPFVVVAVDIAWGTFLFGAVAVTSHWIRGMLNG